jgi:hypothetical protein
MTTRCPYCDIEVSESSIEAEDGCCPECGSVITAPSPFMGDDMEFDEDETDGYGDLGDEDDDFLDDDDFEDELYDGDDFEDELEDLDDEKY